MGRGDWRLALAFPQVPFAQGGLIPYRHYPAGKRITRRSLIAPALLFVIIGGLAIFWLPGPYLGLALVILLPWLIVDSIGYVGSPREGF